MTLISQDTSNRVEKSGYKLSSHPEESPVTEDPWLNTAQLCRALSNHFGGRKIHRDSIRKALKMGLPHEINRLNGRNEFLLSKVLAWWLKSPTSKAS